MTVKKNILFVFAMEQEAGVHFMDCDVLFTGLGKVNAAYHLTNYIDKNRPDMIVNLGSAGSALFNRNQVVCCTSFIQRDMDVTPLGIEKYKTPFSDLPTILENGQAVEGFPVGICGTGDNFDTKMDTTDYNVVDMEAYSYALVALKEDIPFVSLKYITDGADGAAANDWGESLELAAKALRLSVEPLLR